MSTSELIQLSKLKKGQFFQFTDKGDNRTYEFIEAFHVMKYKETTGLFRELGCVADRLVKLIF